MTYYGGYLLQSANKRVNDCTSRRMLRGVSVYDLHVSDCSASKQVYLRMLITAYFQVTSTPQHINHKP